MRMTWNEIVKKYPDKWVGLVNVEWDGADEVNIVSAEVKYVDDYKDKIIKMQLTGKGVYCEYTTPQNLPDSLGLLM